MSTTPSQSDSNPTPLATDLQTLGHLVRNRRVTCGLTKVDAADSLGVSATVLARAESGKPIGTKRLFKILTGLGLVTLILPKDDASVALNAIGHTVDWHTVFASKSRAGNRQRAPAVVMNKTTPTLFLDFDGTLHAGHGLIDQNDQITLDSGRPLFEFAPLLVEMLGPYPSVEIVLTTSWLQKLPTETVISYLPPELARRVVDTTKGIKPRLSYVLDGSERTYVIASYAHGHRLKNWLAIDDSVFRAHQFGREPGELLEHFLLLDSTRGISDESAQQRIREWLIDVHGNRLPSTIPT